MSFPGFSFGNFGAGRIIFAVDGRECASIDTLVRNIQPDLEPKDFRFHVKAHLCTDGAGTSTSRTEASVRTMMSSVTKILSQCGIIVTTSQVVTTVVPDFLVDNFSSIGEPLLLFAYDEDEIAIDVYFVQKIDSGNAAGTTLTPTWSVAAEAGIAIADRVGPFASIPLNGQNAARTMAHEIGHYLLNHFSPESTDHRPEDNNLMFNDTVNYKRDLDQAQCLEMRANFGVD